MNKKNDLTNVRVEKIGLCRYPAVEDATHVLMKSIEEDGGKSPEICQPVDPARRVADDNGIAKALESAVSGIMGIIAKLRGSEKTITETNDMDISKATAEEIQKANPALYDAIVAKAVESLKEKNGSRVGAEDVQGTVDEKDGKRLGAVKVAGATEAAVDTRQSTTKEPLAVQNNGGYDPTVTKSIADLQKGMGELATTLKAMCDKVEKFDTSRPGEAATAKEEKAAVMATQAAVDAAAGESNGGVAKIDTSRPGEAAIATKEKAAVKANAAAVDASAAAGDSGIGGQAPDGDPDKEADAALKAELSTVKDQVGTLTKALPDLQKAVAMLIRKSVEQPEVVVGKTVSVAGVVAKAGSQQAGQLTEAGARAEREVKKSTFAGAISTIALAKAGRSVE